MGVVVTATGISPYRSAGGIIEREVRAARSCLRTAGIPGERVDVIVHLGIYRDHNLVEPAVAALVQNRLGIHLDHRAGSRPVFAFDLLNGACGFLTAVHLAQGLLTGPEDRLLVVAGDGHPAQRPDRAFPYRAVGTAALLGLHDDPGTGFGPLRFQANHGAAAVGFLDLTTMGTGGRSNITVRRTVPDIRLVDRAAEFVRAHLAADGLAPSAAALVSNEPFDGFAGLLATRAGIPHSGRVRAGGEGMLHSGALILGHHRTTHDRQPGPRPSATLFVAVDPGASLGCATYRQGFTARG
ncbi:hypothetical protein LKL35_36095 [Streptomyces sp. ET3-23]|uniref:hypothetical protein n=1 Tax=Streptomyces sp. ET3-23 TaxID=2885643 RepID=UPI001D119583|nr:hypothetical protein [Streptomyces sp. ET3-23]MCC2280757.1 hypothetical protein [Streptomyces sp. ET3-23]